MLWHVEKELDDFLQKAWHKKKTWSMLSSWPCNSRRILNVGNVPFKDSIKNRNGNKKESIGISKYIADWLWEWSER